MNDFELIDEMALAFFASAYADLYEEHGEPLRGEIMDQLPSRVDPAARHAALKLIKSISVEDLNKYRDVKGFGHYAAMQAMGHGVGLGDLDIELKVIDIEFGSIHLMGSIYHAC